ncbi:MAG: ankyrin repeat domain-containing protein, partial [Fusobacteriaceae bacterium]
MSKKLWRILFLVCIISSQIFAGAVIDAVKNNDTQALKKALKTGNANEVDEDGWTALMIVRDAEQAKLLIKAGAKVNHISYEPDRWSPLHSNMLAADIEVLKVLLDNKADPNILNDDGRTPLSVAAE